MDYNEYISKIKLSNSYQAQLFGLDAIISYEEVFKWKWFATKLKIFSIVMNSSEINKEHIERYSGECLQYSIKNIKGLPKGWQNGVVSINVLVSEIVEPEAISFATSRPAMHFSAIEMPVIFDLSTSSLYYFTGDMVWGSVYSDFIKGYIKDRFEV